MTAKKSKSKRSLRWALLSAGRWKLLCRKEAVTSLCVCKSAMGVCVPAPSGGWWEREMRFWCGGQGWRWPGPIGARGAGCDRAARGGGFCWVLVRWAGGWLVCLLFQLSLLKGARIKLESHVSPFSLSSSSSSLRAPVSLSRSSPGFTRTFCSLCSSDSVLGQRRGKS